MTDVKKAEKKAEDKTPEVASEHVVGEDIYYQGVDGSRWVERGANK